MANRIRQQSCANCNYLFQDLEHYCPHCGQDNHSPNQPIKHYISELTESLLHLDAKLFYTLKILLLYPGKMTSEYNQNIRARFTPPVRLYVFISFIFFVLIQIPHEWNHKTESDKQDQVSSSDSLSLADTLEKSSKHIKRSKEDTAELIQIGSLQFRMSKNEILKYKNAHDDQIDSLILAAHQTPSYFTRTLFRQIIKSVNADEDFFYRFEEKSFKFGSFALFLIMPFFGFLLYLFYLRRKKYYYEYLIFSVHFHTVVFLVLGVLILINLFIHLSAWWYLLMILFIFYYLGKALRYNFRGSRKRTILKMILISILYTFTLMIVFIAVVFLGWWFV